MDIKAVVNETIADVIKYLTITDYSLVGSSYILGKGKDIDVLVLVPYFHEGELNRHGWVPDCSVEYKDEEFRSFRKGDVNLLVTTYSDFFEQFVTAARVCKFLRVKSKATRITIHNIVRDGYDPDSDPFQ